MADVYLVYTEYGEYEQWQRDMRGVFATSGLAEAFAAELRTVHSNGKPSYDVVEVVAHPVLRTAPVRTASYHKAAWFDAAGAHVVYDEAHLWAQWQHEVPRLHVHHGEWGHGGVLHPYLDVQGWAKAEVLAAYDKEAAKLAAGARG